MSEADRDKWDMRHAQADVAGEHASPSRALVELDAVLPRKGRALDIACGRGRNALWLAARGLDVTALDISPVALADLLETAEARGVEHRVHAIERDLDDGLPRLPAKFDVVACLHFHDPRLWPAMRRAVAPGGLLVVEALAKVAANSVVKPRFLASLDEIAEAAGTLRVLRHEAVESEGHPCVRLVARRER